MAEVSLSEAASRYLASVKDAVRQKAQAEVYRFIRWYGADRSVADLRGHEVSLYGEALGPANTDTSRRADQVRAFLAFLKKEGFLSSSLAPHLRLRKAIGPDGLVSPPTQTTELTRAGLTALEAELQTLISQRPVIAEELRGAMLDKDFRENAPLDAVRDKQAHLEARIRDLEVKIKQAVIVENQQRATKRVHLGSTVILRKLDSGTPVRYTIVGPHEADAVAGKISNASPVGRALLDRGEGEQVEINVPAGVLRFQIEQVED